MNKTIGNTEMDSNIKSITIDIDSLWEHQFKTHDCKSDKECTDCHKKVCELCSVVHVFEDGKLKFNPYCVDCR